MTSLLVYYKMLFVCTVAGNYELKDLGLRMFLYQGWERLDLTETQQKMFPDHLSSMGNCNCGLSKMCT